MVVPSFHEVGEATETGKSEVNKAEASRIDQLEKAAVDRQQEQDAGRIERQRITREAKASLFVVEELRKARRHLDLVREGRFLLEALLKLTAGGSKEEVSQTYLRLWQQELRRQARWSDDRMRLETLAQNVLKQTDGQTREMVLIDASVPFASFLYALDQLREVIPLFLPTDRGPPGRGPLVEPGERP